VLLDRRIDRAPEALLVVAALVPSCRDKAELTELNAPRPGLAAERAAQGRHVVRVDRYDGFPADGPPSDGAHPHETDHTCMADVCYEAIQDLLP